LIGFKRFIIERAVTSGLTQLTEQTP